MTKDYVFEMNISEQDLASDKNPPLCDGCSTAGARPPHTLFGRVHP